MYFNKSVTVTDGVYSRLVPLTNSFGKVFPSLESDLMTLMTGIGPQERVLDIGGGANPFSRADVVTEPFPDNPSCRSGLAIKSDIKYVQCFAEKLPFGDRSFGFAMARQVFEHVNSPTHACREMIRVAARGFIETPRKEYELLSGPNPSHQWLVSVEGDALLFERRMFIRHPLRHIGLSLVPSSPEGQLIIHWEFKNLTNVQFYWEGEFDFQVTDSGEGFDYTNPLHASEAHLDVAICSLLHGGHHLPYREFDAREALRLRPDWALAHNTLGVILWKEKKYDEAKKQFIRAAEIDDRDQYQYNSKLQFPGGNPIIADFDYTQPMDEKFWGRYSQSGCFDVTGYLHGKHCI